MWRSSEHAKANKQFLTQLQALLRSFFLYALILLSYLYGTLLLLASVAPRRSLCSAVQHFEKGHNCTCSPTPRPSDCSSMAALTSSLDRYAVAHLTGWVLKGIVHPRRVTLWAASIFFEVAEYIASKRIPFLTECWWDTVLLDIGICNAIGIELGILLAPEQHRRRRQAYKYVGGEAVIVCGIVATDLNFFLLREVLKFDMTSPFQYIRMGFFLLLAVPASAQLFRRGNDKADGNIYIVAFWTLLFLEALHWLWL